ncbi:Kinesin-like protein [Plasmodiophora brassicae]
MSSPPPLVRLLYQVRYAAGDADRLVLSGSIEQLGGWDLSRAVPLESAAAATWRCQVDVPAVDFQYAYVVLGATPTWSPKRTVRLRGKHQTEPVVCITDDGDALNRRLSDIHDRLERASNRRALDNVEAEIEDLRQQLSRTRMRSHDALVQAKQSVDSMRCALATLRTEAAALAKKALDGSQVQIDDLLVRLTAQRQEVADLRQSCQVDSSTRRALLGEIGDLRGKVRVIVRVRPRLESDAGCDDADIDFADDTSLCLGDKLYTFDRVLGPDATQADVFGEVRDLFRSCLDGFTCSVFSYGATNSGKTFSMEGPPDDRGVTFRALQHMFDLREERSAVCSVTFAASVVEIYNETLRDLLVPSDAPELPLDVMTGGRVTNLTWTTLESVRHAWSLIMRAVRSRSTGATLCNERSSRSHLVVCLTAVSVDKRSGARLTGRLALVDLAGSERLRMSGAVGDRLRESQAINKSLSTLSKVIRALSDGDQHVPFRDSRLTFLLQDFLSPSAKVATLVHVSPCGEQEGLSTLRFAQRCKLVDLGPARRRLESSQLLRYKVAVAEKDRLIESLRAEIVALRGRQPSPSRQSTAKSTPKSASRGASRRRADDAADANENVAPQVQVLGRLPFDELESGRAR